ncbi:MAG: MFS transporter [Paracoccaceae bacterium]|nr:MFS transporter [Paracoccaceae bacterium]
MSDLGQGDAGKSRRIWGWFFYFWAAQPYFTLLLTFIFAPYVVDLVGKGTTAQAIWGYGISAYGLIVAISAPFLGAIADKAGGRKRFIAVFSIFYVLGAWGLWYGAPGQFSLGFLMLSFGLGLIATEISAMFANAMLVDLGDRSELGRISGSAWGFGYIGGVVSLVIMLLFFAEQHSGRTLIGLAPGFGLLDATAREGTRAVGPFTALWFIVFSLPFFLWTRDPRRPGAASIGEAVRSAWPDLRATLSRLPANRNLMLFLIASMLYRDALNGIFTFGGIYASGVLGWSVVNVGIFGILAAITGAVFAWLGGKADSAYGPKVVIIVGLIVLTGVACGTLVLSRTSVFGIAVGPKSALPDITFYVMGALIGACAGSLQAASRTMMVLQANPERMTEAFGLYALAGQATSFIAPFAIAVATDATGSQQAGIAPLIVLFVAGFVMLLFVRTPRDARA